MRLTATWLILVSCLFLLACERREYVTTHEVREEYANGKHVIVKKETTDVESRGGITGTSYSSTHHFDYQVSITPGRIYWEGGGSSEPKYVLFCGEDSLYFHYVRKKSVRDQPDVSASEFIRHVDERFFFKLLGKAYWLNVESEDYQQKQKSCKEFPIPNDDELSIPLLIEAPPSQ